MLKFPSKYNLPVGSFKKSKIPKYNFDKGGKLPIRKEGESDEDYYSRWGVDDYMLLNRQIFEAQKNYKTLNQKFLDEQSRVEGVNKRALEIARKLGYNEEVAGEELTAKGKEYNYNSDTEKNELVDRTIEAGNPQDWEAIGMDFINDPNNYLNNLKTIGEDGQPMTLEDWTTGAKTLDAEGNEIPIYHQGMGCIGSMCGIFNTAGATQVSDFPTGFGNNVTKAGEPIFRQMSNKWLDANNYAGMKAMGFVQGDPKEGAMMRIANTPGSDISSHSMMVNKVTKGIDSEGNPVTDFDWDSENNVIENQGDFASGIQASSVIPEWYENRASYWNYVGNTPQYKKEAEAANDEYKRLQALEGSSIFPTQLDKIDTRVGLTKKDDFEIITERPNRTRKEKRQFEKNQAAGNLAYPLFPTSYWNNKKYGGSMAPIIPTWNYPSEKTFVRDTTDAPPRIFNNGGGITSNPFKGNKKIDKRKAINKARNTFHDAISHYKWNPDGTPISLDDELRNYYNSVANLYSPNKNKIFTKNREKSIVDRQKYKSFIKNTMDDIYSVSDQNYLFEIDPKRKYNIASSSVKKIYSPEKGYSDYIEEQNTVDVSNNPKLLAKWKQRRNKAKMMNHVLAELSDKGYGELPTGYNDEDWNTYVKKYEEAIANAKNKLKYEQARKDVKRKNPKIYKGSDGSRKFLEDYEENNWIQFDSKGVKEKIAGSWAMQDRLDTEEKRKDFATQIELLDEATLLPAAERVYAEPGRSMVDFTNTTYDLVTAPFVEGDINPLAYNYDTGEMGVPYWQGAQGAMDVFGLGTVLFPELRALSRSQKTATVGDDVVRAGFGLKGKSKIPTKLSPEQAAALKELNFTEQQIKDFTSFFPEADAAFIDDYIKQLQADAIKVKKPAPGVDDVDDYMVQPDSGAEVKGELRGEARGTSDNITYDEQVVKYDIDGNEIPEGLSVQNTADSPVTLEDIKATIEASPEAGTYFQGKRQAQIEGVEFHKDAYINKLVEAHPDVDPNKIRTAIKDLRGETALEGGVETYTRASVLDDPELSWLAETPKRRNELTGELMDMDTVFPWEDKAIYGDFQLEYPDIFPRNPGFQDDIIHVVQDNLDILEDAAAKTSSPKTSLTPKEEIQTAQFVQGYDTPLNFPFNPLGQKYADDFNKLITKRGNQLKEEMAVSRSDRDFYIDELGKDFSELKVGDEFTNKKFKSTSVGPSKSMYPHKVDKQMFGEHTSLIKLPSGQSIYFPARNPAGQQYLTEIEGILPRDLRFKLDKVNTPYEQGIRSIKDIGSGKKTLHIGNVENLDYVMPKHYDRSAKARLKETIRDSTPLSTKGVEGIIDKNYFLRKSRIPWSKNYYAVETPTFTGRQDFTNKLKSKLKSNKVKININEAQQILKKYNAFKTKYPEKAKFEFSITNPYRRGGYLNGKYTYGRFSK